MLAPIARPDLRFLLAHPARLLALGFGSGLPPRAPGTFGTLFGWAAFVVLQPLLPANAWPWIIACGFVIGVWACRKTGRDLGSPDHGAMVWDEIIAIWLVLLFTPAGWLWQLLAFGLFRFFDILKPPPIRWFDRRWKGGFGVMWDDLLAAFYALLVLAVIVRVVR